MAKLITLIKAFEKTDLQSHCEDIETALGYYEGEPNADEFIDWYTDTYIYSAEIIYYRNAMNYLMEHDASLRESMGLAADMGMEPRNLDSETLATLLLQQNLSEEMQDMHGALEEYFEEE